MSTGAERGDSISPLLRKESKVSGKKVKVVLKGHLANSADADFNDSHGLKSRKGKN